MTLLPEAIHVEKVMGFGLQRVFCFTFPDKAPPRVLGIPTQPEKMWIGHLLDGQIESVLATLEAWSPQPVLSVAIRCDDGDAVAKALHRYFGLKGNWQTGFVSDIEEFWMEYEKPEHVSVGELITHYRRRAGLNPVELADAAGISADLMHRIEGNAGRFAIDIVQNVVNELGLTLTVVQKG